MSNQLPSGAVSQATATGSVPDGGVQLILAADGTAPVLTSPTGTSTGITTATIGATTDEGNGTFYGVVSTSATAPSAAQVKAGQMHTGAAAAWAGSVTVTSVGAKTLNATGLTSATNYYGHLMHEDAATNQSAVVSSAQFTTSAGDSTLPTLTGSITVSALTATSYTLTWPAGSDNVGVTGYEYRLNGGSWVDVGNVLTVNITGRTSLGKDVVEVRAYDAATNRSTPAITVTVYLKSTGITGAELRAQTEEGLSGPGILYNDWDTGDDAAVFVFHLVSEPSAGTLTLYNDGSFSFVDAPNGSYSFTYRLFVDGVDEGTATVTLLVGVSAVSADFALSYALRAAVSRDLALSYPLRAAVSTDFALSYTLEGSGGGGGTTPVSADFAISYPLRTAVSRDFAFSYLLGDFLVTTPASRRLRIYTDDRSAQQLKIVAPGAILDFVFSWGESYLQDGETIASFEIGRNGLTQPAGRPDPVAIESDESVLVWNQFTTMPGERCTCDCTVTTSAGRRDTRRFEFLVGV